MELELDDEGGEEGNEDGCDQIDARPRRRWLVDDSIGNVWRDADSVHRDE